jgi:YggT family protein
MGRPWWHDSYWQKETEPRKRFKLPGRRVWIWVALAVISLLLAASSTGFRPIAIAWSVGFVYYLCRILTFVIFVRVILSWFMISRYNILMILLDDVAEPILSPLRRFIPRLGVFDITPIVAIAILYFIPFVITRLAG